MTEGVAACTEDEFIALWREHKSGSKVAEILNLDVRAVFARRRGIEKRRDIVLPVYDQHRPQNNKMLITHDRVEVKLTLSDGVIMVISDQHFWPSSIPTMHRAFCHQAKKIKPFATIWNGDAFDGSSISRFQSIGWENKPSVTQEINTVRDRSAEVIKASPNSKRIWTAGNHDLRMESRLANVAPEFADMHGVHLKDHIPEWTPAWFVTVNEGTDGHTEIRHREKGGIHAGYNNTVQSGVNIVTGHDHRADVVPYDDRRGRRYGVRAGMGADSARDPQFVHYLEGRKANWQSAFAVLTYHKGALLYPELALRVDDDHYQFRGEVIEV